MPYPTAVLGYAFMLIGLDRPVGVLNEWATKVLTQQERLCELAGDWRPPDDPAWLPAGSSTPAIFEPLYAAIKQRELPKRRG